jgi:PAS domain S-box-containing protein
VHDRAEVDFDEDGTPLRAFGTLQDITDRKQAEVALSQSEQRLRLALDAADMGIWEWDVGAGTYQWNDQTYRMLGYDPQSFVPDYGAWARRVHPDDLPKLEAEAQQMMENAREALAEYRAFGQNDEPRWLEARGRFECHGDGRPKRYYGVLMDITERKRAEERDRILTAEVNHRAKNLLAVVQAVALQTASSDDPKEFAQNFNDRLAGLAASQDLLVQSHWQGVDAGELVKSQLSHFAALIGQRILLNGPPAQLKASAAQTLGMAIHELATNASKYGALSSANGIVQVSWRVEERDKQPRFTMQWSETSGKPIKVPERRGFGHSILVDMAEYSLESTVSLSYPPTGLVWQLSAPMSEVLAIDE